MRLALYQPDIPQNAGTMLRLAACMGIAVDLIGPAGFDVSDRAFRRAGLDYLEHVSVERHSGWTSYMARRRLAEAPGRLVLLTIHGAQNYTDFAFKPDDSLLLGRESAGVPDEVHDVADTRIRIPISPGLRSLNVAIAAAMVLGEALRQTSGFPTADGSQDDTVRLG